MNEGNDGEFHYEDHGEPSNCPSWMPASPPGSAGNDPLVTTVSSGGGTPTLTLAAAAASAACASSACLVYPDNSAAMAAAIIQVNADALTTNGAEPNGSPCVLIPSKGIFYLSALNTYDILGMVGQNGTLCIRAAGRLDFFNMPPLITTHNVDVGGLGGSGDLPGRSWISFENATGFVLVDGVNGWSPNGSAVHGFASNSNAPIITVSGAAPSTLNFKDLNHLVGGHPNVHIGGNVITWSLSNFIFQGGANDYDDDSIVISLQEGGTTNTFQIGSNEADSEIFNKAITIRSPYANPSNGGCQISQMTVTNVFYESGLSPGFIDDDSYNGTLTEGCSLSYVKISQSGSFDPLVGVADLYGTLSNGFNSTTLEGMANAGPVFSAGYYSPGVCGGGGIVVVNSNQPVGQSWWGCGGTLTNVAANGVDTDGTFLAVQADPNLAAHPAHALVAARPYFSTAPTAASGGSYAAGTYFFYVTGCTTAGLGNCTVLPGGNTTLDTYGQAVVTVAASSQITLTVSHQWASSGTFDHLNIWQGTTSNGENVYFTQSCPCAFPVTVTLTGAAGTSGSRPSVNTAYLYQVDSAGTAHSQGIADALATKSSAYTLAATDSWINVTGTTTITAPHAIVGQRWVVFNSGSATVTLAADSGNMNGTSSITLAADTGKEITCDGTNCFAH